MALSRESVESIGFTIAKQKYYNAHKVDACLDELKPEILALLEENEKLRAERDAAEAKLRALSAAAGDMKNAQAVMAEAEKAKLEAEVLRRQTEQDADELIVKTKAFAGQIIDDAQKRAEAILSEAMQEASMLSPVKKDGHRGGALSLEQLNAISSINEQLEELNITQTTQLMRIRQAIMTMATDM